MNDAPDSQSSRVRSSVDDVIDLYKRDIDRTLLRENLNLTPEERVRKLIAFIRFVEEARKARRQTP